MEIKLSQGELSAIAADVVRQLKREGLVAQTASIARKTAKANGFRPTPVASPIGDAGSYSIATAAEASNRHPHTIRMDIKSGKLKASKVKGVYQIRKRDLERYSRTPKYARAK